MATEQAEQGDPSMPFEFLSEDWVREARLIRAELQQSGPPPQAVRINLVVTQVPGRDQLEAHVDTTGGLTDIELGHLEGVDVTVTLDFDTAKAIFVNGGGDTATAAFMAGRIRVDGDIAKLMAFQGGAALGGSSELTARIRAITA
ncbi:MAG: SCP2 sterol-binding domain-containing protein [Acidimicrobiales bacterium]